MGKKVYSAGIVDHSSLVGRPFGLRQFNLDFLAITIEGKAMFLLEEKGIASEVIPVNMVYVPAGKTHLYDPNPQSGWLNCWTLFDGVAARNAFSELIPSTGITLLKSGIEFYKYWEKLSSCMLENDDLNDESAFCILHQILLEIKRQSRVETDSCPSTAVIETMRFMKNNLRNPELDFKHLANQNGICPESLRKRFKRETGTALHQYFLQLKINAAKSMLSNLAYNIGDLADFLGFEDQYYFSRLFKKKTGISPMQYRKKLISDTVPRSKKFKNQ